MQRFIPYLSYQDAPAAIDFLERAFGFEERSRYPMDDGRADGGPAASPREDDV